jgi:hypothetical protein
MRSPPQPYPLTTAVGQNPEGRSSSEFWSALGVPPRPAFSVTVTLTAEPFDEVDELPAVRAVHVDSTSIPFAVLAGRVLDATLAPVPSASVTVVGAAASATSSAKGEFVVPGLDFGDYTLDVQAAGRPAQQVSVTYRADHQFHTVVLTA